MIPPSDPRLSLVTLGARRLPELRAFYERLGFPVAFASEEYCSFLLGGVVLALWPIAQLTAESGGPTGAPTGFTLAWNVDTRDQVDPTYARAVAAGATVVSPPEDREWGGRSAYVADPEGNRWEIAWAPGMGFDERGAVTHFGT